MMYNSIFTKIKNFFSPQRVSKPKKEKKHWIPPEKKEKAIDFFNRYSLIFHMFLACGICFIIEWVSRHSFTGAFAFMFDRGLVFLYNSLLVFASLTLVYLFRRRVLMRTLISVLWLFLGIINGCILLKRVTPFSYTDLKMVNDLLTMQSNYFNKTEEMLVIAGVSAVILLLAEFLPPRVIDGQPRERRHIVSVFKLVQDLLEPSDTKGKSRFQVLMGRLPPEHKARWFAGAALNTSEQSMASVLSTVLSRLNAFLDTELEQTICFDSPIDAESFASRKSAIFLVLPEEDQTKNFMAGLMIQNLSRELFSVADENGGKLKNRVVLFCDEFGTMPPFDVLSLFSAGRSRKLTMLPIIQSLAQLEKNYGKEGSEIIQDNCQDLRHEVA